MKSKLMMFVMFLVLVIPSVYSFGITPSKMVVDFNSDINQKFSFNIVNNENKDFDVIVYPRGDFAPYVSVNTNTIHISSSQAQAKVLYDVNFPYFVRKPGDNVIEVVVEEVPSNYSERTAVGGKIALVHQLVLKSPLDGFYARALFTIGNTESGHEPVFTYTLFNEGTKKISNFDVELEIFNSAYIPISKINSKLDPLGVGEIRKESVALGRNLLPGDYYARTNIRYEGKTILQELKFTVVGSLVDITSLEAPDFRLGSINRLEISVYNKFYEEFKGVFAEITVKDQDRNVYPVFMSVSSDLPAESPSKLVAYWETTNLKPGKYDLSIRLRYAGKVTDRVFEALITANDISLADQDVSGSAVLGSKKSTGSITSVLVVTFILLIIANIILIMYIRKRNKNPPTGFSENDFK